MNKKMTCEDLLELNGFPRARVTLLPTPIHSLDNF